MLVAGSLYAEIEVRDGRVTANLQSQPLNQVLDRLKTQINMRMVVDEGISGKTVSANFQDLPLGAALKKILEGTGINYAVLAGPDGQPQSVFIGGSARPGTPPRRLDNRPVNNRGVVSPVQPPPPPSAPAQQPEALQPQPLPEKTIIPGSNVPTGGGFVPEKPQQEISPEQQQQQQEQEQGQQPDNEDED